MKNTCKNDNISCQIIESLPHCFYFLKKQIVETIFMTKLNTLGTKYNDTLTFNFTDTINPMLGIMLLARSPVVS